MRRMRISWKVGVDAERLRERRDHVVPGAGLFSVDEVVQ
jgi:hypothetical protein